MKKYILIILLISILSLTAVVNAEYEVETGIGKMEGHTTYTIEFIADGDTGKSELAFNIDTLIDVLKYKNKRQNRPYSFSLEIKSNHFFENSGILIDTDWENGDRIIYSETDTDLELLNLDLRFTSKNLLDQLDLRFIAGYEWQDYNFMGYGTVQTDFRFSPPQTVQFRDDINTIAYEINYYIPYLALSVSNNEERKRDYNLIIGYSPATSAVDEDTHILRNKVSRSVTNGYSYFVEADLNYIIRNNTFFKIGGKYVKIDTDGSQTQYGFTEEGNPYKYEGISVEINSTQAVISAGFQKKF